MLRIVGTGLFVLVLLATVAPLQAGVTLPFQAEDLLATGCSAPNASVVVEGVEGVAPAIAEMTPTAVTVTCIADCGSDPDVSCNTTGTCTAVDRNCDVNQRGYVDCNGSVTYCLNTCVPPFVCNEGDIRYVDTGGCCKQTLKKESFQRCINNQWVHQYYTCAPVPFCPVF